MMLNTMTVLLIVHGLLAVALLGAITHQALAVWWPVTARPDNFVARFRAVATPHYVTAIVVLYLITFVFGGIIYTHYRVSVRVVIEQLQLWKAHGLFELKEHFLAIGLGILPAYVYFWRHPADAAHERARDILTLMLCFIVWWSFLVGHIINNLRGFGL